MSAAPYTMSGINCFGIPSEYRGWKITQECDDNFYGHGPNYDCDYNDEDGFVGNGEQCVGRTWDELKDEIDTYIANRLEAALSGEGV